MKHEWKKQEKQFYLPKNTPELRNIPKFKFLTIKGSGNPNESFFAEYIGVLYSLSYAIKFSPKKGIKPNGYFDYSVYPLEGVWDLNDKAKNSTDGRIDKNDLVFKLMIRQPDFVEYNFAMQILDETKKKKPHNLLEHIRFEEIIEGDCIQMLHLGSYDNEPESFRLMEVFAEQEGFKRTTKTHKEIYLNDFRKVSSDKLKTVLRFNVDRK